MDAVGNLPSFREWLYSTRVGDLTTGRLYPYLKSKQVYLCPTDAIDLAANDYSGQVGPFFVSQSLSFRHRNRGHLVMSDLRVETMDKKAHTRVESTKRFWFPTDDTSGPGGINLWPPR